MSLLRATNVKQRGDTIVEVMIATAIISLVLAVAYVTTNKNTALMQASQEHEQAQRLVEAQIETLRYKGGIAASGDCFVGTNESGTCNNFTASNSGATYTLKITGPTGTTSPTGTYTVSATWTSIGSTVTNNSNVTMYYRLN
jgi:prepilin-type N-terminal cleavage/methylation domain-containing protein